MIRDDIKAATISAMKSGDKSRVSALRLLLSELQKDTKEGTNDEVAVLRYGPKGLGSYHVLKAYFLDEATPEFDLSSLPKLEEMAALVGMPPVKEEKAPDPDTDMLIAVNATEQAHAAE